MYTITNYVFNLKTIKLHAFNFDVENFNSGRERFLISKRVGIMFVYKLKHLLETFNEIQLKVIDFVNFISASFTAKDYHKSLNLISQESSANSMTARTPEHKSDQA